MDDLADAIDTLISDNGGLEAIASVDATYRTRLETLETDTENLINRVTDMSKIADVQDANITALQGLSGLAPEPEVDQTIAELETANNALISTASTIITNEITAAQAVIDAGVGGAGGLATTLSQSQFNIERARLLLSDQLIDLITPLPALNTALLNAQAGGPSPENDSIAYFDADLLDYQSTIESAATNLQVAADLAVAKAQEIIATDQDEDDDDLTDRIPTSAEIVKEALQALSKAAEKQIANSALTRTEVALRTLQRQYLFDQLTSNLAAIQERYSTQITQSSTLAAAFAELKQLENTPVIAFPDTPLVATPEGKSGVEQLIDIQTSKEVDNTQRKVTTLNDNKPASPALIGNGTARMKPILRLPCSEQDDVCIC